MHNFVLINIVSNMVMAGRGAEALSRDVHGIVWNGVA